MGPILPDCYYRVSVKALITNSANEILVVNEQGGWGLPGGGVDWGEDPVLALHRELMEELGTLGKVDPQAAAVVLWNSDQNNQHLLWLIYRTKVDISQIKLDADVTEFKFLSVAEYIELELGDPELKCSVDYGQVVQELISLLIGLI